MISVAVTKRRVYVDIRARYNRLWTMLQSRNKSPSFCTIHQIFIRYWSITCSAHQKINFRSVFIGLQLSFNWTKVSKKKQTRCSKRISTPEDRSALTNQNKRCYMAPSVVDRHGNRRRRWEGRGLSRCAFFAYVHIMSCNQSIHSTTTSRHSLTTQLSILKLRNTASRWRSCAIYRINWKINRRKKLQKNRSEWEVCNRPESFRRHQKSLLTPT